MSIITHRDELRHGVQLNVPCKGTAYLLENVYETWTRRTYYLWGIPIWHERLNIERRPIHEFIDKCIYGYVRG